MAFYFALFNVANANQDLRDQHREHLQQRRAHEPKHERRRHSVASSSSNRSFFSDYRNLPKPKVINPRPNDRSRQSSFDNDHVSRSESRRRLSSPEHRSHSITQQDYDNRMTMSASAKFHHNTDESPPQPTPCCSPVPPPMNAQQEAALVAEALIEKKENKVEEVPKDEITISSTKTMVQSQTSNTTTTSTTSKKVTFMSTSVSMQDAKRRRKLSADNIADFLDLGDLAAWNMKAVIIPKKGKHSRQREPFIEIPSNPILSKLKASDPRYIKRRGSAAAEIRLPDRQSNRVSRADSFAAGSATARHSISSPFRQPQTLCNRSTSPRHPIKVHRSMSSRTADVMEAAALRALRLLHKDSARRTSAEENGNRGSVSGRGLNEGWRSMNLPRKAMISERGKFEARPSPSHQSNGQRTPKTAPRSIIRRRSTSDQQSFIERCQRKIDEQKYLHAQYTPTKQGTQPQAINALRCSHSPRNGPTKNSPNHENRNIERRESSKHQENGNLVRNSRNSVAEKLACAIPRQSMAFGIAASGLPQKPPRSKKIAALENGNDGCLQMLYGHKWKSQSKSKLDFLLGN
ncbi:hypothetical protein DdX_09208 [Ditylenchus destructor]|uniref:Uncharacterized protein n=1 Tax=Ditylenchus destructor TaxID=166010 RepID=A0AAD4R6B5_9BILA|nr:hypothetical protein DdX_09208 [Ditylenchus destructor]